MGIGAHVRPGTRCEESRESTCGSFAVECSQHDPCTTAEIRRLDLVGSHGSFLIIVFMGTVEWVGIAECFFLFSSFRYRTVNCTPCRSFRPPLQRSLSHLPREGFLPTFWESVVRALVTENAPTVRTVSICGFIRSSLFFSKMKSQKGVSIRSASTESYCYIAH